jgi:hypothetical protein
MTYQAAVQKIEQAAAEQWEELDLAEMELTRALNALKEAGKTAFEEAIDHPVAKVLVAGLEGYLEG